MMPAGRFAAKVPKTAPSLARSFVTVCPWWSVTQMLAPSKATPVGDCTTGKLVVRLAGYQCRIAICAGFLVELVTPPWASAEPHSQARARGARMLRRIAFDIRCNLLMRTESLRFACRPEPEPEPGHGQNSHRNWLALFYSVEAEFVSEFATQILVPSKATPLGCPPTEKVPRSEPSVAFSLVTVLAPVFVTQMLAPSKATPWGPAPTAKVPSTAPSLARSFVTVLSVKFVTQTLVPSIATPRGVAPTVKVPSIAPSLARSLATALLLESEFATQMLAPSKATPLGETPATGKVPSRAPSLALNLLTVQSPRLVTQTFAPSKAIAQGSFPTAKVPSTEPSLARNLLTVLAPKLTTHMLAPS